MLFKIICVGKIKEEYYSSQIQELCKQINKKNRVEIIQSEDEKIPKNASDAVKQKIIETESRNSLASIGKNDFVIALCIEGKKYTTEQFAAIIRQAEEREYEAVVRSSSSLRLKKNVLKESNFNSREYIQKELDLDKKNVAENLRRYFYEKEKME